MATIMVVEDNPDNMKLFRTVLALKGHRVIERGDGEGLLDALAQAQPDLVLMDIQLPGRDGFALLQEIRDSDTPGYRVVALTAHAMAGDLERALAAGFDGYLTKPVDIRRLPHQVVRALNGEQVTE